MQVWLKEGFTRYLEFVILSDLVGDIAKEYLSNVFMYSVKVDAMLIEANVSSESLCEPIKPLSKETTRAGVMSLFSILTYSKTAAVLCMWDLAFGGTNGSLLVPDKSTWNQALVALFVENKSGLFNWFQLAEYVDRIRSEIPRPEVPSDFSIEVRYKSSLSFEPLRSFNDFSTDELMAPWLNNKGFPL